MYTVVMCLLVILAPPIVVGEWSMAFLLRQHIEYYLLRYMYMHICTCFIKSSKLGATNNYVTVPRDYICNTNKDNSTIKHANVSYSH